MLFFRAKPGREKSLKCCEHITPTRGEPGNIAYVLHRSTKNPDELVFDEIFVSIKAFEEHAQKPYVKSLASKIDHLVDEPVKVETYSEV